MTENNYVTQEYLEDKHYLTKDSTTAINNITNQYLQDNHFLTKDSVTITNIQDKLATIEENAEENVQSDWNVTDAADDAFIKNKPNIKDSVNQVLTENNYVTQEYLEDKHYLTKDSLTTINNITENYLQNNNFLTKDSVTITNMQTAIENLEGAEANVQSDWDVTDATSDAYIKNKPNIKDSVNQVLTTNNYMTQTDVANYLQDQHYLTSDSTTIKNIQTAIENLEDAEENVQSDWNVTDTDNDAYIKNKPNIKDSVNQVLTDNKYVTENYLEEKHYLTKDSTTTINNIVNNYLTTNEYINEQALIDSNYVKTTELPTEQSAKFTATAGQTAFTISSTPNTNYLVKIYINGILIGDNNTGVVTVSGTTVTYVPAENEDYALEADDKILIYWFK